MTNAARRMQSGGHFMEERAMNIADIEDLFDLGTIAVTRGVGDALTFEDVLVALYRHSTGDWGELSQHDEWENRRALAFDEGRLFSRYVLPGGVVFYVITETDRTVTTVLLAEEY